MKFQRVVGCPRFARCWLTWGSFLLLARKLQPRRLPVIGHSSGETNMHKLDEIRAIFAQEKSDFFWKSL